MATDTEAPTARWCDSLLDWVAGALAAWTLVFHLARLVGASRDATLVAWLVVLLAGALVLRRFRPAEPDDRSPPASGASVNQSFVWLAVVGGLVCAAALAWLDIDGLWWPVVWLGLVGVLAGAARAVWRTGPGATATSRRVPVRGGSAAVVTLAVLAAVLSLVLVRPDQDDVFVVNRSTWVAEHPGAFPERDTVFSNDVLPSERPAVLPTSVEALIGAAAARLPGSAPGLTYLVWAPLVSALGVLAIWRLLRVLGSRSPVLATWAGTAFLVLDGEMHASFGNFFAGRAWQGKAAFLLLVVPALWHHGAAWGRTGDRRRLAAAALGLVAGLGLTSSAAFLGPTVLLAAAFATALDSRRPERLGPAAAATLPAVAAGGYALFAEPQRLEGALGVLAAVDVRRLLDSGTEPWAVVRMVVGGGLPAFVALGCALTAWTVVRNRSARLVLLAGPVVVFAGFLAPGMLDLMNEVGDADAVAWRTLWVLPLPAMVGLVVTAPRAGMRAAQVVAPVVVLAVLAVTGTPITSGSNRGAELVWPPAHDLPRPEAASAATLAGLVKDGGRVAGPEEVDFAVAVLTTRVRATNPRSSYLVGRHVGDGFAPDERAVLSRALDSGVAEYGPDTVAAALEVLAPDALCLRAGTGDTLAGVLRGAGYREVDGDGTCRFWLPWAD